MVGDTMTGMPRLFDLGVWTRPLAYGKHDETGLSHGVRALLNQYGWYYSTERKYWTSVNMPDARLHISPLGYMVVEGFSWVDYESSFILTGGLHSQWGSGKHGYLYNDITLPEHWEGAVAVTLARNAIDYIDRKAGQALVNGFGGDIERLILRCRRVAYHHPPDDPGTFNSLIKQLEERRDVFTRATWIETRLSGILSFMDITADMLFTLTAFLLGAGQYAPAMIVLVAGILFKLIVTVENRHGNPIG